MLSEIKQYMIKHKRVTLGDLSLHFDAEPEAMRGMLTQWIRKGRITKMDLQSCCNKTCSKGCDDSAMEIYEWTQ
jgi:hypothetical protein